MKKMSTSWRLRSWRDGYAFDIVLDVISAACFGQCRMDTSMLSDALGYIF